MAANPYIRRPLLSLGLSGAAPGTAQREAITNDFGRMPHACTAALPAKAGACHSLGVSKAPFASLQKPLGSRQGRWPGSTALPETFGCTCLHRSLACQSRCTSLFRRFEARFARLQKHLGSRQGRWPGQPAGPLAGLHSPLPGTFGCTCLHRSLACQSRRMSLFRRFESTVCQASNPSRQPAGPLARLQSPSRNLWLHMPAPQPCLPKPVHVTL